MASTYLSRTIGSTGNRKICTTSIWFKRANLNTGANQALYLVGGGYLVSDYEFVVFSSDQLVILGANSSAVPYYSLGLTQKIRDVSAWYHLVYAIDTTQATASDRVKIWINGERVTAFDTETYPSQNFDTQYNLSSNPIKIGDSGNNQYFDGSMTHFHFIDGTAYDASTFGESDANGVWKPKTSPSVTYGTNGFFLKFENSGSMGTDSSPNGNNFTVNGTMTQTLDTPSNVYATLNPLIPSSSISFSNGNTTFTNSATDHRSVASTLAVSKGKWYAEVKIGSLGGSYPSIGIFDSDVNFNSATYFTQLSGGWGYNSNGNVYNNDSGVIGGLPTWTTNDIIGVAVDCDNDKVYWSKNGTWVNSADPSAGTGGISITADKTWYFAGHSYDTGTDPIQNFNFGNGFFGTTAVASAGSNGNGAIFEYDVPTGYYALNTKNLATYG